MSILQFLVLASASALTLLIIAVLPYRGRRHRRVPVIDALNLLEDIMEQATVGVPKLFTIAPSASGEPVDLVKFPTALTGVTWVTSDPAVAAVNVTSPDGLAAEVTFLAEGTVQLVVSGANVNGDPVQENLEITGSVPVPVVDALNLKAA